MNRLTHQLARDGHLTFRSKCRDLVIKIFGHEAQYDHDNLADIAICDTFDLDIYRLNQIRLKDLALRKLFNPFKWLEFLVTAPLELISWGVQRGIRNILIFSEHQPFIINIILNILPMILMLIFPVVNVSVNAITGLLRRILAPVRYIVRPSIELAKMYPSTFWSAVGMTLLITGGLTATVLTGGLPALGGLFLAAGLGLKGGAVSALAAVTWAGLLKCVCTIRECLEDFNKSNNEKVQQDKIRHRNKIDLHNEKKYTIFFVKTRSLPDKKFLDEYHKNRVPMLIYCDDPNRRDTQWVYGAGQDGETRLTKIEKSSKEMNILKEKATACNILKRMDTHNRKMVGNIYRDIKECKGHYFSPDVGTTGEISRTLHAMNPELAELKTVERQDACYSLALFTGTEAIFYPVKNGAEEDFLGFAEFSRPFQKT